MPVRRILFLSCALALLLAGVAMAADLPLPFTPRDDGQENCGAPDCCARCGCHAPCQRKVCRVVCKMKTVTKHCWRVECEEFCAPLPACGLTCKGWSGLFGNRVEGCATASSGDHCSDNGRTILPPKCGPVRTRKKLVKVERECQVPVYSCEVKFLCSGCAGCAEVDAPEELSY